jgi:hypothetical protein
MGHSLVALDGRLYLFGGYLAGLSSISAELFVLDPASLAPAWGNISSSSSGNVPSARALHGAAALNNNKMFVCMGRAIDSPNGNSGWLML